MNVVDLLLVTDENGSGLGLFGDTVSGPGNLSELPVLVIVNAGGRFLPCFALFFCF